MPSIGWYMLLEHQVIWCQGEAGDQITVREKHIPTDLVHSLLRKYETFYTTPIMARSSDNYILYQIMIKLPKENIS